MSALLKSPAAMRAIRMICLVPILVLVADSGLRAQMSTSAKQHLEITGSHELRLVYDFSFNWPAGSGGTAVFKLPVPPDTGGQKIEHFTSSLKGTVVTDEGNPPHRILTATLHHERGESRHVDWRVEIVGQFQTRQLVDGPRTSTTPIVPPAPGEFLAPTESINWDNDKFSAWLSSAGLYRNDDESSVQFAQRVYSYLQKNGRYHYPPDTTWNAAAICHGLRTDCGGFSLVFVAACRANQIPARLLVGQCFKAKQIPGGSVELTGERQTHVIAEFFDPQIGWIPEDISSTFLKMPGYADLNFFGRDPGYFFAWHFDADFHFNLPRKDNAHVQWIQNPSLWFSADADDANDSVTHHWTVETIK